jgi:hypothetical protein
LRWDALRAALFSAVTHVHELLGARGPHPLAGCELPPLPEHAAGELDLPLFEKQLEDISLRAVFELETRTRDANAEGAGIEPKVRA